MFVQSESLHNSVSAAEPLSEEAILVERSKSGDQEAFGQLVDKYHKKVYGIVYRMCGPDDAEDVTQEVFLKAYGALDTFRFQDEASFRTWLYRIAFNSAVNELRRRKRRTQVEGSSLDAPVRGKDGDMEREYADTKSLKPAEEVERNETQRMVHEVLQRLKPQHRQVLIMIDLEQMEYKEAAEILGCPLGTLKSRVARARTAFGKEYKQYLAELEPDEEVQTVAQEVE